MSIPTRSAWRWLTRGIVSVGIAVVALLAFPLSASLEAQPLGSPAYRPIDQVAIDDLAEFGTTVELLPTEASPENAAAVASRAFGQTTGKKPQQVSLATVTVSHYRTDVDGDLRTEDSIPIIKDRRVWLVIFDGFKSFAFGPAPSTLSHEGEPARYDITRLIVYVDAETQQFLYAHTIE